MTTERASTTLEEDFHAIGDHFGADVDDPFAIYREKRRNEPVMKGDILQQFGIPSQANYSMPGREVFTLFKYQDVATALRDGRNFTSGLLNEGIGQFLGDFMLTAMDGEKHKLARNMLAPAFAPSVILKWRDKVERVTRAEGVDPLTPKGKAELINDVLLPLPVRLIYEVIGYPNDRAMVEQFASWGLRILVGPQKDPARAKAAFEGAIQATQEIYDHTLPLVQQRRAEGSVGDGLIGYLLRAQYDGRFLTDDEITSFIRQLLPAAAETTTRTFGSMLLALLERPALMARVRADRTLIQRVMDEGMRWCTASQFLARQCAKDVEFRGVKIPAGSALSLAVGSANRDEEAFDNPDEFDIDRTPKPTLGFGFGAHLCLGMPVARLEMEAMLNAMFDAWPKLRLDPDYPPPKLSGVQLRGPKALHVRWD